MYTFIAVKVKLLCMIMLYIIHIIYISMFMNIVLLGGCIFCVIGSQIRCNVVFPFPRILQKMGGMKRLSLAAECLFREVKSWMLLGWLGTVPTVFIRISGRGR
jgi:hypothetical protein